MLKKFALSIYDTEWSNFLLFFHWEVIFQMENNPQNQNQRKFHVKR